MAEIEKNLTWCSQCGRLSATIPVEQRYRCPHCNRWNRYYLFVRGYKHFFYRKKEALFNALRK